MVRCITPGQPEAAPEASDRRPSSGSLVADLAEWVAAYTLLVVLRKAAHTSWAGPAAAGTSLVGLAGLAAAVEPACTFAGRAVLAAVTSWAGPIQWVHPAHARFAWHARPQPAAFSSS